MLSAVNKKNVSLEPGIFSERGDVNREYLMELSIQGLLQNFYLEAGIVMPDLQIVEDPATAKLHWGWEAPICQLRGHFLGHFLSAASMLVVTNNDRELKAKVDVIVDELEKCQKLNGGQWLGPFPEKYFKKLERNEYIWSPQYVMHKLIMGLTHVYQYAQNEKALELLSNLADWYVAWTEDMAVKNPHAVYSGEEGGMIEAWSTLYEVTGNKKYLELANKYNNPSLYKKLLAGKDALTNTHANASIPLAHGAAKMYEITGDEKWLIIVKAFWKCAVEDRDAYCTGGQNAGEFWIPPHRNGQFLGERNQEFCTVYNMVRLADYLYRFTGDKTYGDYIEKNLYNGFLAQQNKMTGMPTYFLPMKAGSKKKWGSKTHDFWCCYGTMVQAQTLYPSLCYYKDEKANSIVVSQYIPSKMQESAEGKVMEITQSVDMKYYNDQAFFDGEDESQMSRWLMKFEVKTNANFTMSFRIPEWVKSAPVVTIDDEEMADLSVREGYLDVDIAGKDCVIRIFFPAGLSLSVLPDRPQLCAVLEGPIVLAGLCDKDKGLTFGNGDIESVLKQESEHTYSSFPWMQSTYRTVMQPENMTFMPLYDITDEQYTIYFTKKTNSLFS
ncbi:MAG: glycoside hydrolase family 127 protein [Lachnospiraceae bacterium]|nr:glycoside hydrolase family 127 protein [Lachnospiraceae bacterium]